MSNPDKGNVAPQRALPSEGGEEQYPKRHHTPGPWTFCPCGKCGQIWTWAIADGILIGNANHHAADGGGGNPLPRAEWEANQRLMAAAPKVVDIALAAITELRRHSDFIGTALLSELDATINGTDHWLSLEELKAKYAARTGDGLGSAGDKPDASHA